MLIDNKKAPARTEALKLYTSTKETNPFSDYNMGKSNSNSVLLYKRVIAGGIVFYSPLLYSNNTTVNPVVRFGDLFRFYKKGAQTPLSPLLGVFLCLSFNGSRAWETMKVVCWFSFFVPVRQPTHDYRPICLATNSGSFLNQQIRKLYKMSTTTTSKQIPTKKHPFIRQFFYKHRIKKAINALNSNKPLIERLQAFNSIKHNKVN